MICDFFVAFFSFSVNGSPIATSTHLTACLDPRFTIRSIAGALLTASTPISLFFPLAFILLNLLSRIGVVNSEYLKKTRRYVIVIIFTLAAILTPPDPITQVGLAIPLLLLYELSIITVRFTEKKD